MRVSRNALILGISIFLLIFGTMAAVFSQWKIERAAQNFPPPPIENLLAAEKTYGVSADLTLYSEDELARQLDAMQSAGIKWIRQPFLWADIEATRGQFQWEKFDRAIASARLRGFEIIAVLDTSPAWARPEASPAKTPPSEVTDFGVFARTLANTIELKLIPSKFGTNPILAHIGAINSSAPKITHNCSKMPRSIFAPLIRKRKLSPQVWRPHWKITHLI